MQHTDQDPWPREILLTDLGNRRVRDMGGRELPREKIRNESEILLHWRVLVPITLEKVCDCHVDRVEIGVDDLVFGETSFTHYLHE